MPSPNFQFCAKCLCSKCARPLMDECDAPCDICGYVPIRDVTDCEYLSIEDIEHIPYGIPEVELDELGSL